MQNEIETVCLKLSNYEKLRINNDKYYEIIRQLEDILPHGKWTNKSTGFMQTYYKVEELDKETVKKIYDILDLNYEQ